MRYTRCFADRYMMEHIYHDFYFGRANEFKFWNVGQGLFYTGSLFGGEFNFVYDCGGKSAKAVKLLINEYLKTTNTIDALFISHFHNDHINGIEYLKHKCRIKELFIPYYSNNTNYILVQLINSMTDSDVDGLTRVWNAINSLLLDGEIKKHVFFEDESVYVFPKNRINNDERHRFSWKFVLSCNCEKLVIDEVSSKIDEELKKYGIDSLDEYLQTVRKIDDLKKIIKSIIQTVSSDQIDFNNDSLCVLHYPLSDESVFRACEINRIIESGFCDCNSFIPKKCHAPATLLTGDGAVLQDSNTQLEKYSDNDEISTKVMQIPHHGAKEEWSKTVGNLLSNRKYCFENYVVSYGFGNNYGHPTYELIDDLAQHNIEERLYSATQFTTFEYTILNR